MFIKEQLIHKNKEICISYTFCPSHRLVTNHGIIFQLLIMSHNFVCKLYIKVKPTEVKPTKFEQIKLYAITWDNKCEGLYIISFLISFNNLDTYHISKLYLLLGEIVALFLYDSKHNYHHFHKLQDLPIHPHASHLGKVLIWKVNQSL